MHIILLYFAWVDERDRVCFIFHKVARVLYGKYSTIILVNKSSLTRVANFYLGLVADPLES